MKKTSIILLASLVILGGCGNKVSVSECRQNCVKAMNEVFDTQQISTTQLKAVSDKLNECLKDCEK